MKYCQRCGAEIDDNADFCFRCGQSQSAPVSPVQSPARRGRRLHCPQCKSTYLSPIVETSTTGGNAVHTPITRGVGVTTYTTSNTHRNYWICQECGHKFRNLENLNGELAMETKRQKGAFISSIVFGIVCLLEIILCIFSPTFLVFFWWLTLMMIVAEIILLCIWLSTQRKVKQMVQERAYLKRNCFN